MWLVAFGGTILFGVQLGILIAVVASLGAIVVRSSRPHHATLGRLPGSRIYRDLRRYPGSATVPGVAIFRFDAELHFANKETLLLRPYWPHLFTYAAPSPPPLPSGPFPRRAPSADCQA